MRGWGREEGRTKTVDVVAMPAIITVATTRGRKTMPVYEGGGSSSPPLPSQPQQRQQIQYFWQQRNDVDVNAPMTAKPGQEDGITRGRGGGDGRRINVIITIRRGSIQAAVGAAEPPAYHHGLLPLDPFCAFATFSLAIERRVLEKQPLLVVLSSYVQLFRLASCFFRLCT